MAAALKPENEAVPQKAPKGKWKPKKWRPEYDRIVGYSALGRSNVWIAENLQFTPEHVSTILNLPEAKALMEKLQTKLRERIVLNIPEVLDDVAQMAVKRLKQVMESDELFEKSPFAVIDRGMDVLKGLNHLRGGGNGAPVLPPPGTVTNIGVVNITPGQKSDITMGLEKIAEVRQLHSGTGTGDGTQK